mmetsp:Transcript_12974/g.36491  ORF Transcript_12974/g.36491 Transcript_12974/m.36491 type:complete len:104 (-) Transcript_12974:88-399(-)|eukprot:CAMPEP_0117671798 /NCGR_PEP_ID=MMETSP0804-20121206/13544_1 /TAXON_ID=1074897 /ORGANISM="Tetraselmis astigmatica, Strain CCMP880" /LENGTH=103 /DNA_ID=CAMNT_0005480319 /DNA_START=369 /DNA_END=680 /DNA_ORIENTATION=+
MAQSPERDSDPMKLREKPSHSQNGGAWPMCAAPLGDEGTHAPSVSPMGRILSDVGSSIMVNGLMHDPVALLPGQALKERVNSVVLSLARARTPMCGIACTKDY